jgi:hypothetical protein
MYAMQIKTFNQRCYHLSSLFFLFAAQLIGQNTNIETSTPSNAKKIKTEDALTLFLDFKTFNYSRTITSGSDLDSSRRTLLNEIKTRGFYPSLSYTHHKANGHFTEMALTFIQFQNQEDVSTSTFTNFAGQFQIPTRGAKTLDMKLGFRIGYNIPLYTAENSQFILGISNEPILAYNTVSPRSSAAFPSTMFEMKSIVALMPRFVKNLNKKVFLDFNVPFSLFSTTYRYENMKNPILPFFEQRRSFFEMAFVPRNFQLRMGVGVRI